MVTLAAEAYIQRKAYTHKLCRWLELDGRWEREEGRVLKECICICLYKNVCVIYVWLCIKRNANGNGIEKARERAKIENGNGNGKKEWNVGEFLNGVSKVYNNGTKPHSIRLRFAHITRILPICVVVDFKSFLYKLNKQIIWNHCNLILQMKFGWTVWHKMRTQR